MKHSERIRIAKELCGRIVAAHKVYYVGVYGSVARNEDMKYSDLEFVAVSESKSWWGSFSIGGLRVWIDYIPFKRMIKEIGWVEPAGTSNINNLLNSLALYDKINLKQEIRKRLRKVKYAKFLEAAQVPLGEAYDYVAKMRNALEERGRRDQLITERDILLENLDTLVALVNRAYFTHGGIDRLLDISKFRRVPKNYVRLSRTIRAATDMRKALAASEVLLDSCIRFAGEHGVRLASYRSIEEAKV